MAISDYEFLNSFIRFLNEDLERNDIIALESKLNANIKKFKINYYPLIHFYRAIILKDQIKFGINYKKQAKVEMLCACLLAKIVESDDLFVDAQNLLNIPLRYLKTFDFTESDISFLRESNPEEGKSTYAEIIPAILSAPNTDKAFTARVPWGAVNRITQKYPYLDKFITSFPCSDKFGRLEIASDVFENMISKNLPKQPLIKLNRVDLDVITFGSCFATNLSKHLSLMNIKTSSMRIEELVNNPVAVADFFDWIYAPDSCKNRPFFDKFVSENREIYKEKIAKATHFVLTVGVGYVFEKKGDVYLSATNNYLDLLTDGIIEQRLLTIDECVHSINKILTNLSSSNSTADIYVTLSPVPLSAVYKNGSVISSDVLSKSTIRLAIEKIAKVNNVHYWPAFEIVKWLSPHVSSYFKFDSFAEDDNQTRHPSDWVVKFVVDRFVRYISND